MEERGGDKSTDIIEKLKCTKSVYKVCSKKQKENSKRKVLSLENVGLRNP